MGPARTRPAHEKAGTRRAFLHRVGSLGVAAATAGVASGQLTALDRIRDERVRPTRNGSGTVDHSADAERTYRPLEVVHRWNTAGEVAALESLLDGFNDRRPSIESHSVVGSGDSGGTVETALRRRIVTGSPPSTFLHRGGRALDPFVNAVSLHQIDDLWTDEMDETFHPDARQATHRNGSQVAVPASIHRVNTLFYNVALVERAGVDPDAIETPRELLEAIDAVQQETDAAGMAHSGSSWSRLQLFSQFLLGAAGLEAYAAVIAGDVDAYRHELEQALSLLLDVRNRSPGPVERWDAACRRLSSGTAAFLAQGDWAVGEFYDAGFEHGEEWNAIPFPGTAGWCVLAVDCFVFPRNNPSPDATAEFLAYLGTPDAQRRFNESSGSLPARGDVSVDEFGPFQQSSHRALGGADVRLPSIAHGMAIGADRRRRIESALAAVGPDDDPATAVRSVRRAIDT